MAASCPHTKGFVLLTDLPTWCAACLGACPDLKQQIAEESSTSHELMLELEQAQHEGPAAKELAKLKAELAQREEEQLAQRCRCG